MIVNLFRNLRPAEKLIFTGLIVIVIFLVSQLFAMLIAIPFFGFDQVTAMMGGKPLPPDEELPLMRFFQIFQTLGLFALPSFIAAWLFSGKPLSYLKLDKKINIWSVVLVFVLIFIANPFIEFMGELNSRMQFPEWMSSVEQWMRNMEDSALQSMNLFLTTDNIGILLFNIFMIAILPALSEELLFRGVVQKLFTEITRNAHWGVWLSALLFSAFHFQFYGFIPRLLLGVLFGYLFVWSGSLWLPIFAHFVNNTAAILLSYFIDNGLLSHSVEHFVEDGSNWLAALISLAASMAIAYCIRKSNRHVNHLRTKSEE